jgi:hypothetical protein
MPGGRDRQGLEPRPTRAGGVRRHRARLGWRRNRADDDPAAGQLAARLAPWIHGSFSDLFDGPTTTRPDGHLVVWSLRHLPDELRTIGTLLALDAIWRSVDAPDPSRLATRRLVVVDEAWLLMRDGEGARFLFRMSKAARKRHAGLSPVGAAPCVPPVPGVRRGERCGRLDRSTIPAGPSTR